MLLKKYNFECNFKDCFIKDFDLSKFLKKFPQTECLLKEMKNLLEEKFSYYLVDLIVKDHKVGEKTCRDIRYHLDGDFKKDNQYCMWLSGKNRTIFSIENIDLDNLPVDRNKQSIFLDSYLKNKPCFEAPNETIIKYNSLVAHKGVICKSAGKRVLFRLMATNYISPKNFIKIA